jgi:hypothetical protein
MMSTTNEQELQAKQESKTSTSLMKIAAPTAILPRGAKHNIFKKRGILLLYYLFSLALLLGLYCTVCIIFVSPCIQYLHVIFCDETGWRLAVLY